MASTGRRAVSGGRVDRVGCVAGGGSSVLFQSVHGLWALLAVTTLSMVGVTTLLSTVPPAAV